MKILGVDLVVVGGLGGIGGAAHFCRVFLLTTVSQEERGFYPTIFSKEVMGSIQDKL